MLLINIPKTNKQTWKVNALCKKKHYSAQMLCLQQTKHTINDNKLQRIHHHLAKIKHKNKVIVMTSKEPPISLTLNKTHVKQQAFMNSLSHYKTKLNQTKNHDNVSNTFKNTHTHTTQ
jgi:hypothetical protein